MDNNKKVTFGESTVQMYNETRPPTNDPNILEMNPHIQPEQPGRTWSEYINNYYRNLFPDSTGIKHHSDDAIIRSQNARRRRRESGYHDEQKLKKKEQYADHV